MAASTSPLLNNFWGPLKTRKQRLVFAILCALVIGGILVANAAKGA